VRRVRVVRVWHKWHRVVAPAAGLVEALARRGPNITVVATSRERLGVGGEHVWPVLPLAAPPTRASEGEAEASPAVALFLDRARAARAGFALDAGNTEAVVEIC